MGNPVDLNQLDGRLQEIHEALQPRQPLGKALSAVDQFICDYEHGEPGPKTLFRPRCRASWRNKLGFAKGSEPFEDVWIQEIDNDELDDDGKKALTQVCCEMLRFIEDGNASPYRREKYSTQLEDALSEYLSLRNYEVGATLSGETATPDDSLAGGQAAASGPGGAPGDAPLSKPAKPWNPTATTKRIIKAIGQGADANALHTRFGISVDYARTLKYRARKHGMLPSDNDERDTV